MAYTTATAAPVIEGVPLAPPAPGTFVPAGAYVSPEIFDLEMREVFPRAWVFVAETADLVAPGDFVTNTVGYEPVVVVRGHDLQLRAFSNVCPHRASLVAEGKGNCGARLSCPYHGWSFRHDGTLAAAPFSNRFEGDFRPEGLGLVPVRMDVWEHFVFVNLSGDAPPLVEWLEAAPAALAAHRLTTSPRRYLLEEPVDANWKITMDNGICGYHPTVVHADSLCRQPYEEPRGVAGRNTASVFIRSSEPHDDVMDGLEGPAREGAVIFNIYPNFVVSADPNGSLCAYWWRPVSIDRTVAGTSGYSPVEGDPRMEEAFVRQIQEEDYVIVRSVQAGLRSRLYRPGPQHLLEFRVHAFQQWVMERLRAAYDSTGSPMAAPHSSHEPS